MALPITYLFVPGNRPDRFDKALTSGADAVILDLEDAVDPAGKQAAREAVRAWCAADRDATRVLVRINDTQTAWFAEDIAALRGIGPVGVMLPKAESPGDVSRVVAALGPSVPIVPLIETALGLRAVDAIAAAEGVQRLAFGTLDFAVDLGLSGDERGLAGSSMAIALGSRCAGRAAPIAGVTPAIEDLAALDRDTAFARAFGFAAKLCIHPKQVAAVRAAFAPTEAELDWARRVLTAAASGVGAVQVDGRMVDRPVLRKAQSLLDLALPAQNRS
jgi:citrate lyase subunit beta / citryl-CoA lyase